MGPSKPLDLSGSELRRATQTQLRDLMEALANEYQHVITARFNQQTGVCAVVEEIGKGPASRKVVMLNSGFRTERAVAAGQRLVQPGPFRQIVDGRPVTYLVTEAGTRIEYDEGAITAIETVKGERTVYEKALGLATYVEETTGGGPPVEITIGVNEHHAEMRLLNWANKRFKILAVAPTRGCCADCNRRLRAALKEGFEDTVPESRRTQGDYRRFNKQFKKLLQRAAKVARQGESLDALKAQPAVAERFVARSPAGTLPYQREQIRRALARFRISDTKLLRISKVLKVAGPAMIVFDAMTTYARAAEQWERGARDAAAETLAAFGGRMAGAYVGAESFGLMFGALGSVVPGLGTTVGALAGAVIGGALGAWAGEQEAKEFCRRVTAWSHGAHGPDAAAPPGPGAPRAAERLTPFSAPPVVKLERHMYQCGYGRPEIRFVCETVQGSVVGHSGGGPATPAGVLERAATGLPTPPGASVEAYPWPAFVADGFVSAPDDLTGAPGDRPRFDPAVDDGAAAGLAGVHDPDAAGREAVWPVTGEAPSPVPDPPAADRVGAASAAAPLLEPAPVDPARDEPGQRSEPGVAPAAETRAREAVDPPGSPVGRDMPPDHLGDAAADLLGSSEARGRVDDAPSAATGDPAHRPAEPVAEVPPGPVTDPPPAVEPGSQGDPIGREASPDHLGNTSAEPQAIAEVSGSLIAPPEAADGARVDDGPAAANEAASVPAEPAVAETPARDVTDPTPLSDLGPQSDPVVPEVPPDHLGDPVAESQAIAEVSGSLIAPDEAAAGERVDDGPAAVNDVASAPAEPAVAETPAGDVTDSTPASDLGPQSDPVIPELPLDHLGDPLAEPQAVAEVSGSLIAPHEAAAGERVDDGPAAANDAPPAAAEPAVAETPAGDVTDPAPARDLGPQSDPVIPEVSPDHLGDPLAESRTVAEVSGSLIAPHGVAAGARVDDGPAAANEAASAPAEPAVAETPAGDVTDPTPASDLGPQSDPVIPEVPPDHLGDPLVEPQAVAEVSGSLVAPDEAAVGERVDDDPSAVDNEAGSTPAEPAVAETPAGDVTDPTPASDLGPQSDPVIPEVPPDHLSDPLVEPQAVAEVSGSLVAPDEAAVGERVDDDPSAVDNEAGSTPAEPAVAERPAGDVTDPTPASDLGPRSDPVIPEEPPDHLGDSSAESQAIAEVSGSLVAPDEAAAGERVDDDPSAVDNEAGSTPAEPAVAETPAGDVTDPAPASDLRPQSDSVVPEVPPDHLGDPLVESRAVAEVSGSLIAPDEAAAGERVDDGPAAVNDVASAPAGPAVAETPAGDATDPTPVSDLGPQSDPVIPEVPPDHLSDPLVEPQAVAEVSGSLVAPDEAATGERVDDGPAAANEAGSVPAEPAAETVPDDPTDPAAVVDPDYASGPADPDGPAGRSENPSAEPDAASSPASLDGQNEPVSGDDVLAPADDDADVELDVSATLAGPDDALANGSSARDDDPPRGDGGASAADQETDDAPGLLEPADDPVSEEAREPDDEAGGEDAPADAPDDDDADDGEDEDDDADAEDDIVAEADDDPEDLDDEQGAGDDDDMLDAQDDDDAGNDDDDEDDEPGDDEPEVDDPDDPDPDDPEEDDPEDDDPEEDDPEGDGPEDGEGDDPEGADPEDGDPEDGAPERDDDDLDGEDDEEPEEDPEEDQAGEDGGAEEPDPDQDGPPDSDPQDPEDDQGEDRQGDRDEDRNDGGPGSDANADDDDEDDDDSGGSGSGSGSGSGGGGSGWDDGDDEA